jgi:hypothetical protein
MISPDLPPIDWGLFETLACNVLPLLAVYASLAAIVPLSKGDRAGAAKMLGFGWLVLLLPFVGLLLPASVPVSLLWQCCTAATALVTVGAAAAAVAMAVGRSTGAR